MWFVRRERDRKVERERREVIWRILRDRPFEPYEAGRSAEFLKAMADNDLTKAESILFNREPLL